ncbi:MAG: hypothetical protein WDA18_05920 [Candidatus Ratteibacteria bacterium]
MIPELPAKKVPTWLENAIEHAINGKKPEFVLRDILQDSLYYPACDVNGTPVKYLTGNIHSFIYADYLVTKEKFLENLNGTCQECGFKGYRSVYQRDILKNEILPDNWDFKLSPLLKSKDDDDLLKQLRLLEKTANTERCDTECEPFAHWSIWLKEEKTNCDDPLRAFSFLFLCGEMSAIYSGLYCRLAITPMILSIIQPFGPTWNQADCDKSFFKKVVALNSAGWPPYLLYGGTSILRFYIHPCWSDYRGKILTRLGERYAGLWKVNVQFLQHYSSQWFRKLMYFRKINTILDSTPIKIRHGRYNWGMSFEEYMQYLINEYQGVKRPDGLYDFPGDVNISNTDLHIIPHIFGTVKGDFYCFDNELLDLDLSPQNVEGSFICIGCQLTDLKGCPQNVGGDFACYDNQKRFTEKEVRSKCNVGGEVYV